MKKLLIFFFCISALFSNTYDLKMSQLEVLKQNKEKYLRQKNIVFSEFEKLQLDEKIIQKELEIIQFIQERLEEKKKYQVRIEELNELISLFTMKDKEISKKYNQLKEKSEGISKLDLDKMYSDILINKNQLKKTNLEKEYIIYLLSTEEYSIITDSMKKEKIKSILESVYSSLLEIKVQELKLTDVEKKGETLIKIKTLEMLVAQKEKEVVLLNHDIKIRNLDNKYQLLLLDNLILKDQIEILLKEQAILEQRVTLGATSNKELFEKILEKYKKMEEKIRIEGEIKLKEIELNQ